MNLFIIILLMNCVYLFGKKISTIPYQSNSIDLDMSSLKNGIYIVSEPNKGIYEKVIKND